ncbi:MAG: zinc-ribbon domain-containing protein, partial [Myxococcota bacterium]|nr:zinc-ribbon domain-containing protein [Myxococcota bacterium]
MEVTCSRCQSVYDFEDTLVSTKGVVVRCTHCGHLFKVFPPDVAPAAAEESGWMLRREDGTVFAIDRFSTLQKWIAQAKVTRRDELSRTGESWKRLGDIIELAPFFETVGRQAGRGRAEPTLAAMPAPSALGRGAEREHLEIPLAYQSMVPPAQIGVPSVPPDEPVERAPFRIEAAESLRQEAAPFAVADASRADTAPARPSRKPVMPPGEVRLWAEPEPEEDLPRRRRGMAWLVLLLVVAAGAVVAGMYHRQIGLFFRRVTGTDPGAATETERILEKAARLFSAETAGSVREAEVEYDRVLRFNIGDTRALGGLLEMRTMRAQYARDELDVALLLGMPDKDPREVERLQAAFDTEMARAREMSLGLPAPGGDTAGLGAEALRALADMERLRGDRERSADLLGAVLALAPEDPRSLHVRAMLVMDDALSSPDLVGATAEVEAAFGRALAADAGRGMVPRARIHLALYLALVGRRDEAAAQVRCVIDGGSACPEGRGTAHPDHLLAGKVGAWLSLLPAGIAGPVPPALPSHTVVQPSRQPAEAPDAGPEIVPAEAPDAAEPADA